MSTSISDPARILNSLPGVVLQTNSQWTILYFNPAWQGFSGYSIDQHIGSSLQDLIHKDDGDVLNSTQPTFRLRMADGTYRWVHLQLQTELDEHGQVIHRVGFLSRVAAATQHAIEKDRHRFLRLLETIDGVVWEAERGVGNTFLSSQTERLFGYTVKEWRADPNFWRSHVHPDDFDEALRIDEAAYNATHSYAYEMNYRFFAKSGKVVWVRDLCRVLVEPGHPTRMIGLMIDVTQQKLTELELLRAQGRFTLASKGSNDGIWDWDLQSDVLHVSKRFNEILGLGTFDESHTNGWQFLEALIDPPNRERARLAYRRHVEGLAPNLSVDIRILQPQGRLLWVNWRGLAQFEDGVAVRMAGSLSDLAERGSSFDALTSLPGRPLFLDRVGRALAVRRDVASKNDATMFAVLLLDLNGFKAINDQHGHHVGDELLKQVARRLEASVRQVDLVARMSGDEFLVLLESVDAAKAAIRAQVIAGSLAMPYDIEGLNFRVDASIGVVTSQIGLPAAADYLQAADSAMYMAKTSKQAIVTYAPAH